MNNDINSKLENLFKDGRTVSALQIGDYLKWAGSEPGTIHVELAMPPIQRGFVWRPRQIQDLWDSLLRGMPIGCVLVKTFKEGDYTSDLMDVERHSKASIGHGYHLMDGQQRTLSMLLGTQYADTSKHKLWVDFSEAGKNGSQFQFRVTTEQQPFGYSPDGGRLPLSERRNARSNWENMDVQREKRKEAKNTDIFGHSDARPWKNKTETRHFIFEVSEIWKFLENSESGLLDWKNTVKEKLVQETNKAIDEEILQRIDTFCAGLIDLNKQWFALIKIPDEKIRLDTQIEDPQYDYLTMLFDRISSNGTRLSKEDLLFSMLKQSWPESQNIVYRLHKTVGPLMKPTDFVVTAFRMAALQSKDIQLREADLNAKTFHKYLEKLLSTKEDSDEKNPDKGTLRDLIREDGPLVNAFSAINDAIRYKNDDDFTSGIPLAMFPYLNEYMLQVILRWLLLIESDPELIRKSREELIRFVLFWFVCNQGQDLAYKASKRALTIVNKIGSMPLSERVFPGKAIYAELTALDANNDSIFFALPKSSTCTLQKSHLRKQNDRALKWFGDAKFANIYGNFARNKTLLLWFQRQWVFNTYESEFGDKFEPLAGQDDDCVPYDFDHLVPQSNWGSLHGLTYSEMVESKSVFTDMYHRRALGNMIGNFRVLGSKENRERQDESVQISLIEKKEEWEKFSFSPSSEEVKSWGIASPLGDESKKWTDQRAMEFQYAIESRTSYLYNRLIDEANFKVWVNY